MAKTLVLDFDVSKVRDVADFEKRGRAYLESAAMVRGSVARIIMTVATLHALRHPDAGVKECASAAMEFAGDTLSPASRQQYPSQLKGAVSHARAKGLFPTVPAECDEGDLVRLAWAFASSHSLDGLYAAYREPQAAKREAATAERVKSEARDAADFVETVGEAVSKLDAQALKRLTVTVGAWLKAARNGDANARATLLALGASIEGERQAWAKADASSEPQRRAA
jgi:hypothetical protein